MIDMLTNPTEAEPMLHNGIDGDSNANNNIETITSHYYKSREEGLKKRIELVWSDLSYTITTSNDNPINKCFKRKRGSESRKLIKSLNGSIVSGKLTAIMGPSGAGKTTLIECLAARRKTGVDGKISANFYGFVHTLHSYNGPDIRVKVVRNFLL